MFLNLFSNSKTKLGLLIVSLGFGGTLSGCVTQNEINPQKATQARLELAQEYINLGNFNLAKQNLDKALEYASEAKEDRLEAKVYSVYGAFYLQQENWQEAEKRYQKAILLEPKNGSYKNNYAILLCQTKRFEEAFRLFEEALNSPNYYYLTDTYQNILQCAKEARDKAIYKEYQYKLTKISPKTSKSRSKFRK